MTKLLYVITVSQSIRLLQGQLDFFINKGYEVHLITSYGKEVENLPSEINLHIIDMKREISVFHDVFSLFSLFKCIKKISPDIINYGTPKASLLSSITSFILRVPVRIYTIRGLRYETLIGKKRSLLMIIEKLIMFLSTNLISISPSMKKEIMKMKLTKKEIDTLGFGSSNGVPTSKYMNAIIYRKDMRHKYNIDNLTPVLGYVGRLSNDKGITTLVNSFLLINKNYEVKLVLVGDYDTTDPLPHNIKIEIENHKDILLIPHQNNVVPFYSMMDIFVFPTLREGFGNVSIEAAASGLPVVVSNVTGARDTIIDNKTGYLFESENERDLTLKIEELILNPELRINFGNNGKRRALKEFDNKVVWNNLLKYYLNT
jgi:glycosyltransferase involved in cell wall biosynthesis